MKKHLYLLITALAVILFSNNAMAQNNEQIQTKEKSKPPYFLDLFDYSSLYKAKGDIDSMYVSNKYNTVIVVEDKENLIMKITAMENFTPGQSYMAEFSSSDGKNYNQYRRISTDDDGRKDTLCAREIDIDRKRSIIVFNNHKYNNRIDTMQVYYTSNEAILEETKDDSKSWHAVNFNQNRDAVERRLYKTPLDCHISELYNHMPYEKIIYTFNDDNILVKLYREAFDKEEQKAIIIDAIIENEFDERGNFIRQIPYKNDIVDSDTVIKREIYYKQ